MDADDGPDDLTLTVQRHAVSHTVPLLREADGRTHAFGSGVVISVGGRWFVLTAGHVLDALRGQSFVIGAPLLEHADPLEPQTQTTMALTLPDGGIQAADVAVDAGVVEVAPRTHEAAAELARAAVPLDALVAVTTVDPADWRECNVTLSGYPGALSESLTDAVHGAFAYTTGVAGDPPLSPVPLFLREQVPDSLVALWTHHDDVRSSFYDAGSPGELPNLGGASGGGYWAVLVKEDNAGAIYLIATHTCSREVGDERFMWGTPVGFHLKVIAELAPDLADEIFARWPKVRDYAVRAARYA